MLNTEKEMNHEKWARYVDVLASIRLSVPGTASGQVFFRLRHSAPKATKN